jgi:hypothetical protein
MLKKGHLLGFGLSSQYYQEANSLGISDKEASEKHFWIASKTGYNCCFNLEIPSQNFKLVVQWH